MSTPLLERESDRMDRPVTRRKALAAMTGAIGGAAALLSARPAGATAVDGLVVSTEELTTVSAVSDGGNNPYLGATGPLEFQAIIGYGDSYIAGAGAGIAGGQFINRMQKRLSMGTLTNRALGGSEMSSVARRINGYTADKWVPGTKGLVVINANGNQLCAAGFTSPNAIAGYTNALRSALAGLSCASKVESASMSRAGAWQTVSKPMYSGGAIHTTSTIGGYAEATVTVNATGKVDVLMIGTDATFVAPGGPFAISVDGVDVSSAAGTQAAQHVTTTQPEAQGHTPMVVTLSGLTPGSRKIRITKSSGAGALYVDALLVRSVSPPPILLFKQPLLNWAAARATYPAYGYGPVTDAECIAMNDMIDTVSADFPTVYIVDPSDGFDPATMAPAPPTGDHLHLGDRGHAHYADKAVAVAQTIPFSAGLNTGVL